MFNLKLGLAVAAVAGVLAGHASAQNNTGPPLTAPILDLAGTTFTPDVYTHYSVQFTATLSSTTMTIAMRNDPSFIYLDNVSVVNIADPSHTNLVVNGGFEAGGTVGTVFPQQHPLGWTYANVSSATFPGQVVSNSNPTFATGGSQTGGNFTPFGENVWQDGSVQAYDDISQVFATTVGETYEISFDASVSTLGAVSDPYDPASPLLNTFQSLSSNACVTQADLAFPCLSGTGGNGVDILVYVPNPVELQQAPEPATMAILGVALTGLGALRRRRRTA